MKRQLITILIFLGLGFAIGWSQRRVVVEEKVVTKTVTKRDVVTRVIEKPDGTKETTIEEKERINADTTTDTTEERGTKSMWSASVYRHESATSFSLDRRLFGSVHVGIQSFISDDLNYSLGAGIRIEF